MRSEESKRVIPSLLASFSNRECKVKEPWRVQHATERKALKITTTPTTSNKQAEIEGNSESDQTNEQKKADTDTLILATTTTTITNNNNNNNQNNNNLKTGRYFIFSFSSYSSSSTALLARETLLNFEERNQNSCQIWSSQKKRVSLWFLFLVLLSPQTNISTKEKYIILFFFPLVSPFFLFTSKPTQTLCFVLFVCVFFRYLFLSILLHIFYNISSFFVLLFYLQCFFFHQIKIILKTTKQIEKIDVCLLAEKSH